MKPSSVVARVLRTAVLLAGFAGMGMTGRTEETSGNSDSEKIALSPAEQSWVRLHPLIRVGYDPAWPPFSFTNAEGAYTGIDADVLGLVFQRLGMKFEVVRSSTWTEAYDRARRGGIDVLAGIASNPERERDFHFTEPYIRFPVGIIARTRENFFWQEDDLADKVVAVPRNYAATFELRRLFPDIRLRETENMEEAMRMVSDGDAEATVTNLANASFIIKTKGLTNLKIAGIMPETFELRFAVRQDWPELVALLDRGIASLTRADLQALDHRWIRVDYASVIRWDVVWKTAASVLAILASVIAFIFWHNVALRRELTERIRLQRQLEQTHDELKRVHADRGALLQMAAHDLRGPMTGMQLVVDSSLRLHAIPGEEALEMIEKQVNRMTLLLNDILDLEALETGSRQFRLVAVDAGKMLSEAVSAAGVVAKQKGISLDLAGEPWSPFPQADEVALRQIIDNLISNAIKFTPGGGHVHVFLKEAGNRVAIEVHDDGPGVPPGERELIFAKYARGTARPTGGEKSTGLGLSIVRALAVSMGGKAWCEASPDGHGAVFVVELPQAGEPA